MIEMTNFSHLDDQGQAQMVDVGQKPHTARMARASCQVHMRPETMRKIQSHQLSKGDVLQVARLAGIMAAQQTPNLIPLCHPLPLDAIEIKFEVVDDQTIAIESTVRVTAQTGVEMEALMAASIAALTIYDM